MKSLIGSTLAGFFEVKLENCPFKSMIKEVVQLSFVILFLRNVKRAIMIKW